MTPEMQSRITIWRAKCADGTMTLEDYREAIKALRGDRIAAASQSASARTKRAKAEIPHADDLLGELEGL